ncbi:MAG: hydantoinase/oxoprolinase family protein [Methanomicrobiaceae archaeon]|nr:hydantoinase/oxoprolinase family protein [Methanomicrobiaceae archaeon]
MLFTGIDIGGTNTDIAIVDGDVLTRKVPNDAGLRGALDSLDIRGRLAVSTSQPLNRLIAAPPASVYAITIPGPGLPSPGSVAGMVNHRGDILEEIDPAAIRTALEEHAAEYLAICGKFSVRNPALEEQVRSIALSFYPPERIATSHGLARLDFPARRVTTEVNARVLEIVAAMVRTISGYAQDFLFFKGDGGLASAGAVLRDPSVLFNSSPAAVALGARYLTGRSDCLVVDIGGTTTDLVPLRDGAPCMQDVRIDGKNAFIRSVQAESIPFGGDSVIEAHLSPRREGNPMAFGGGRPTLTDALNRCGASIGEAARSAHLDPDRAAQAVRAYISRIAAGVRASDAKIIVGAGFLADHLIPEIGREAGVRCILPDHAACANAIGVAVSRVSLSLRVHVDTGRRRVVINGEPVHLHQEMDDDELVAWCKGEVRKRALCMGAPEEDVADVSLAYFSAYDVIRYGRKKERIADLQVAITPGITVDAK